MPRKKCEPERGGELGDGPWNGFPIRPSRVGMMGFYGIYNLPSGNLTKLWKDPPFLMGKSTISITIFNSYVKLPEGNGIYLGIDWDVMKYHQGSKHQEGFHGA